ncbi:MAG: hypothetical protein ACI399_06670 [Candidatus Cryptobacteroides sp.]
MTKLDLEIDCHKQAAELIDKYFPDFVNEAAKGETEVLSVEYTNELPYEIETVFRQYLEQKWATVHPEGKPFKKAMNRSLEMLTMDGDYVPELKKAREDAVDITLWEKITKTNHEDVTYYKGLLKQYTEELLNTMIRDFLEDVEL